MLVLGVWQSDLVLYIYIPFQILLEKEMAPHSNIHALKIPWTEEPVGYSPWGRKESDTTEQLHFHSLVAVCARLVATASIVAKNRL